MVSFELGKFLTLWKYKGIPVYIGSSLITPRSLAWWWPINWVALMVGLPIAIYRVAKKEWNDRGTTD